MNYQLHKIQEGFIITSDETLEFSKDLCYGIDINNSGKFSVHRAFSHDCGTKAPKVIAQQEQIDFSSLSEKEQKEIGWFDVEKLAENEGYDTILGIGDIWIKGFQKSQELLSDRMFTLEDLRQMFFFGKQHGLAVAGHIRNGTGIPNTKENIKECIKYLSQKSWNIELEMEDSKIAEKHIFDGTNDSELICEKQPKLTNGKFKIIKIINTLPL